MFQFFFENVKIVKASAVFEFKTKIFVVNTSTIALRCKVTLVGKKKKYLVFLFVKFDTENVTI